MTNNTDLFLHSYHWISATRIGSTPQQTYVMLRKDVRDAYIYKEYQLVERIKLQGWDKARLPFPERFIEEVEVLRSVLTAAQAATFQMSPEESYTVDRTMFKYEEGLHRSYGILYDRQTGQWQHQHEQGPILIWNPDVAQWISPTGTSPLSLPWHQLPYEARVGSIPVRWSNDRNEYAVIVRSDDRFPPTAIRSGEALAYDKTGQSYPVRITDSMIGTIEPIVGPVKSPQDIVGIGLWANTRSYLAFIEGLTWEQAQSLYRLVQTPVQ